MGGIGQGGGVPIRVSRVYNIRARTGSEQGVCGTGGQMGWDVMGVPIRVTRARLGT